MKAKDWVEGMIIEHIVNTELRGRVIHVYQNPLQIYVLFNGKSNPEIITNPANFRRSKDQSEEG